MSGPDSASANGVRVVCFDVDGTLVQHVDDRTVWQVFNKTVHGTDTINRARFAAFREGRISYDEWVALDILDWKAHGLEKARMSEIIRAELSRTDGAEETVRALRERGYAVAIISGTLDLTLELMLGDVAFDRAWSNRIEFDEAGRISGWQATPFDVEGKARALEALAEEFGVTTRECAFVGDSWNDLPVFRAAGISIAYRPKLDALREAADVVIDDGSLTALLAHFGGAPEGR